MKALLHLLLIMTGVFALRAAEPEMQKPIELTTLLGETYHNARIIKATPEAITVVHDAGVSKVLFENLGDDWKQKYNYNPDKAREFQKQEDEKRQLAEENRKKAQKEREDESSKQMAELALRESQRAELDAKLARQQAESASRTKALNSSTESVVPPTSPITQIYTPGYTRGQGVQSTIISEGTIFAPGDGSIYYYNPSYGPIYYTPSYTVPYCPPKTNRPPVCPPPPQFRQGTRYSFGNGSFQISR
ncbi:MAG: hypothetical protein WCN98_07155 [Verrucomicrobiaceae bacterium]